jgi:uncharacterized GH25 family protein
MNQFLFSISFCILVHGSANAHDFWIEPSNYRPSVGEPVELALRVGDHFIGFPFPRDPYHMVEFSVHDDSGSRPVSGIISKTPAGVFRASAGGAVVVGYRRNRTSVALEATAFESYLNKVGLTKVLQTRTVEGETTKEGREAYSRYAKTVLSCGGSLGAGYDRLLGFDLEIVPGRNPYAPWPDGTLPVRILFYGQALEGIQVAAIHEDDSEPSHVDTTDHSGRVHLSIDRPGAWMITAVNIIPAGEDSDADWESFWGSLTFERVVTR